MFGTITTINNPKTLSFFFIKTCVHSLVPKQKGHKHDVIAYMVEDVYYVHMFNIHLSFFFTSYISSCFDIELYVFLNYFGSLHR
jgi:hypothetical protein